MRLFSKIKNLFNKEIEEDKKKTSIEENTGDEFEEISSNESNNNDIVSDNEVVDNENIDEDIHDKEDVKSEKEDKKETKVKKEKNDKHNEVKEIELNKNILDVLVEMNVATSKRQAREFISGNSIEIKGEKVKELDKTITEQDLINNTFLIIKRGKKNYYIAKKI